MTTVHTPASTRTSANSNKHAQILAGASKVFVEDGYEGASMDRIAREAGVSKGTLYNYFANKDALFFALVEQECQGGDAHLAQLDALRHDPALLLAEFGRLCLGDLLAADGLAMFRIVLAEVQRFPELGRIIEREGPGRDVARLAAYLQGFVAHGMLVISDTRLAAEQFMSLCDAGIIRRVQLTAEVPSAAQIEAQIQSAVTVFLRAYRADSASAPVNVNISPLD